MVKRNLGRHQVAKGRRLWVGVGEKDKNLQCDPLTLHVVVLEEALWGPDRQKRNRKGVPTSWTD